ncbi:MAG: SDR family NAD(P)-dependent oxidoreductase [Sphingopyxis sp.]
MAGRTALITGASAGLGAHFARLLAGAGANVVLGARRADRVAALADELNAQRPCALAVAMDVGDEPSVIAAFDAGQAAFGTIHTIIANAGMTAAARSTDVPYADIRAMMDANVIGAYLTAREGARRLIAAGSGGNGGSGDAGGGSGGAGGAGPDGRIILIGSITAHMTAQGDTAYAAGKAAVAHMGRNFAREWVRQAINVNVIQPGYIATDIAGDWFSTPSGQAQIAGFHRRRMQPIDSLNDMLLYLASDASAAITGAVIDIDDGQSL